MEGTSTDASGKEPEAMKLDEESLATIVDRVTSKLQEARKAQAKDKGGDPEEEQVGASKISFA